MIPLRFSLPLALSLLLVPIGLGLYRRLRPDTDGRRAAAAGRSTALAWAVFALLAVAAAGPEFRLPGGGSSVVVVLDRSDSVDRQDGAEPSARLRDVDAGMRERDRAALVVFGAEPLVEHGLEPELHLASLRSQPDGRATDIGAAIRLAVSLLAGPGPGRIVLLSDGRQTRGNALREAAVAAARGVPIDVASLGRPGEPAETLRVERVRAPARVRVGEPFSIEVELAGRARGAAVVRLYHDGVPAGERRLEAAGRVAPVADPVVRFDRREESPGLHLWTAAIAGDPGPPGERAGAVVAAVEPPRILVLATAPGGHRLAAILRGSGLAVEAIRPPALPSAPRGLTQWDAVVLYDVPAEALTEAQRHALRSHVVDGGAGLVVLGGAGSFGPDGWARTPIEEILPVELGTAAREERPGIALVLALDKSGSMAAADEGPSRLAAAKEAALALLESLGPADSLGIVAFDNEVVSVLEPAGAIDEGSVRALFSRLEAGGGTDLGPALVRAYDWLAASPAPRKHLVVVSDGHAEGAALGELERLAAGSRVTVSAVGIGRDVDREFLEALVGRGGGRLYLAERPQELQRVFRREGRRIAGDWRVDRRFRPVAATPHTILAGLEAHGPLPEIESHAAATARPGASVVLRSDRHEPILACWRFGLGKTLVLVSDPLSAWADRLAGWSGFGDLWTRSALWSARRLSGESLHPRAEVENGSGRIVVEALAPRGGYLDGLDLRAWMERPDGSELELPLAQTEPGRYETRFELAGAGTYRMTVGDGGGRGTGETVQLGLHVTTTPERAGGGPDLGLLAEIARTTGGKVLEREESPFRRPSTAASYRPLWRLLTLAAMALFLLAVRQSS